MWKEGERTRERTCLNDTWTWTIVWKLTVGVGDVMGRGGQRGENRITKRKKKNAKILMIP